MSKPEITITMEGGVIQDIDWPDELKHLFRVVIMDFDTDGVDPDDVDLRTNERGEDYYESIWEDK